MAATLNNKERRSSNKRLSLEEEITEEDMLEFIKQIDAKVLKTGNCQMDPGFITANVNPFFMAQPIFQGFPSLQQMQVQPLQQFPQYTAMPQMTQLQVQPVPTVESDRDMETSPQGVAFSGFGSQAQLVADALRLHTNSQVSLERMSAVLRSLWASVASNPNIRSEISVLERQQTDLQNEMTKTRDLIRLAKSQMLLDPKELHSMSRLDGLLFLQSKQLDIYQQELKSIADGMGAPSCAGYLLIQQQPFPSTIKQSKPLKDEVRVVLLTPSRSDFILAKSPVKAEIVSTNHNGPKGKRHVITVENVLKDLDSNNLARFTDLKFPNGTRLKCTKLKFSVELQLQQNGKVVTKRLESNASKPFIVKTNENQWYEATGILMKKDAFAGKTEISFLEFSNILQTYYMIATRQDPEKPTRPLISQDFDFIHRYLLDSCDKVGRTEFKKFWEWMGPGLHKIRYQRHLNNMWLSGLICGFITREECDHILANEAQGSFLIRFSARCPGQLAVAYVSPSNWMLDSPTQPRVSHYLIQNTDTAGAKKTLCDFLGEYKNFSFVMQALIDANGRRTFKRVDKDSVLRQYYTKRTSQTLVGYEDCLK